VLIRLMRYSDPCAAESANWPEVVEVLNAINAAMRDPATASYTAPLQLPALPFGTWSGYMESVSRDHVSVFSKTARGRHGLLPPLDGVPQPFDVAMTASIATITSVVLGAITRQNNSPEFNADYHHTVANLEGGPTLRPDIGAIEFVLGVYRKDQGGEHNSVRNPQYDLDLSAKITIRARFVNDAGPFGRFVLTQDGPLRDVSARYTLTDIGVTVGIDDKRVPSFIRDALVPAFKNIRIASLPEIPVRIPNASAIACVVMQSNVVLLIKF